MFEYLAVNASDSVRAKVTELRNIVLEDPLYKEFVQNGGSFQTLRTYVQSNKDLAHMVGLMSGAVDEFEKSNLDIDLLMPVNVHRGICWINRLNGYKLEKNINLFHVDTGRPEVTEKTVGDSMTEKAYAFMEERNYRDIQTDPNALMLLHMAHLSEKMMDKVAEIARLSELETAEKSMNIPQNDENQKEFFNEITDPEELDCILSEEKMQNKIDGVKEKIAHNSEIISRFNDGDPDTKKAVMEAAMARHPERAEHVKDMTLKIEKKYAQEKREALEDEVEKYRNDLTRQNEDNAFINSEIEPENIEKRKFNAELDQQIQKLQLARDEKLKSLREKEAEAEKFRKQRESDFQKISEDYYAKKEEVPARVERLQHELNTLVEYAQVSEYISNLRIIPPQSHFDELDGLQKKYESVDYVRDLMFHLSGNDRKAKGALEMLSPDSVRTVKDLKKKLDVASKEEEAANDKLLQEKDPQKQPALLEKAKETTIKRVAIQEEFEPWKNASDLQDALADLWKNHPDLEKEYKAISKKTGKNTYEALKEMSENYTEKISDLKGTQKQYYDSLSRYEQLAYSAKGNHMRSLEEIGTVAAELQQAQEELKALKKPDPKEYEKETKALCNEIYNKKVEDKNIAAINKSTEEAIQKLQDQRMEPEELRPVLNENQINETVADKKNELDKVLTSVYQVRAMAETNEILNAESAKLMNDYVHGLAVENEYLNIVPGRLQYKKETAEKNYQKTKAIFEQQSEIKEKWEQVKTKESPFADMMEKELESLSANILKGKKDGHKDTEEFNEMKDALEAAHEYLKTNKEKITALDQDAVKEFKNLLTDMSAKSVTYFDLKQKGIHWRPSNMRFVRLNMSKRLQSAAADMSNRIDEMQKLKQKEGPIQSKADQFSVEDPGENYKEYTIHQTPKETVSKLNQKLTSERVDQVEKMNQKQAGNGISLGGKK